MTIHYSVESLRDLFLSDKYISDKNKYNLSNLGEVNDFLNSIEINKQYYRTGILVKNPKYKKKVSEDTVIIKEFKTSLNKLSVINYVKISDTLVSLLHGKNHLYPLIIEIIFEQALLHHTYSKYYCHLVSLLDSHFKNKKLIINQIDQVYQSIIKDNNSNTSEYSKLCSNNKKTDQLIGYCMFLFELEGKHIIKDKINPLVITLLERMNTPLPEDEMYKCVLCLYTLCKQMFGSNQLPETYVSKIETLKETKYMKVKFKLMDILERR